jgi:hypothetical protein
MNGIEHIVTHGGRAHRDDFYAVGLAAFLFGIRPVFRREPTERELDDPGVMVIDVGCRHEPDLMNFDHHQMNPGVRECALSLAARHFRVPKSPERSFHDLWREAPWYRGVVLQDSLGLSALARELGIGDRVPEELVSGIEVFCLQEFSASERGPERWVEFARDMIASKVRTAIAFEARIEKIREEHEVLEVEGVGRVFWAPETPPFGVNRFIKREGMDVVAAVTHDSRTGGILLVRFSEELDFSRIRGEEGVVFAHNAGFMASMRPGTDWPRVAEAVGRSKASAPRRAVGKASTGTEAGDFSTESRKRRQIEAPRPSIG